MNDAILFRGLERLFIVVASVLFAFMGYKLFLRGISGEKAQLSFQSTLARMTFSGAAPGLAFMAFGAMVLFVALVRGGAKTTDTENVAEHAESAPATTRELNSEIDMLQSDFSKLRNAVKAPAQDVANKFEDVQRRIEGVKRTRTAELQSYFSPTKGNGKNSDGEQ